MSLEASVFIATSLDGFIARENGDIDWLDEANKTVPEGEDCGYYEFMSSVDALVMGRNTFEQVLTFGKWPYDEKPVIVLSGSEFDIPDELPKSVSVSSESPVELCTRLSNQGMTRIYVDGGITIRRFLAHGLVSDLTITIIPILLGRGIPLFGRDYNDTGLKLADVKHYDFGFLQLNYKVVTTD